MSMRDLIPWGRQGSTSPVPYPNDPIMGLRREVDRLFDDLFHGSMPRLGLGHSLTAWPNVEVSETGRDVRITAEVPGMSEKDVELLVDNGVLIIRGERKSEIEDEDRGYSERYYGRFERRLPLPSNVDEQRAKADFRDGVLTVTLPKSAEAERGRRIAINEQTKH